MSQENGPGRRQDGSKGSTGQNFIWYMLIAAAGVMLVAMYVANLNIEEISYPDLKALIENRSLDRTTTAGRVTETLTNLRDVAVAERTISGKVDVEKKGPDNRSRGKDTKTFRTNFLPTEATAAEVKNLLSTHSVKWEYAPEPSIWRTHAPFLLITALLILFFIVMMRRLGGAGSPMSFGPQPRQAVCPRGYRRHVRRCRRN